MKKEEHLQERTIDFILTFNRPFRIVSRELTRTNPDIRGIDANFTSHHPDCFLQDLHPD
jgi:hypothetical protein